MKTKCRRRGGLQPVVAFVLVMALGFIAGTLAIMRIQVIGRLDRIEAAIEQMNEPQGHKQEAPDASK